MSVTAIGYVLLYFTGIFKAFTHKPIFGLYAYLLAFYLHPVSRWWGEPLPNLRWSLLAAVVTLLALFVRQKKEKIKWFTHLETKLMLVFAIYVALQSFWAINLKFHLEYVFLVIKFVILIVLIQNCIKEDKDVYGFVFFNVVGCCYFGYLGMSGGGRLENVGGPGLDSANLIAQHVAVVVVMASYLLLCKFSKKGLIAIPFVILALNTVMMTGSRSAIIAIAATGIYSLLYIPKNVKKKFLFFASLGAIALSILMGPQIVERFSTMSGGGGEEQQQDKSAASRLVIIKSQYEMFLDNPILGHGHRGTLLLSPIYIPQEYHAASKRKGDRTFRASHNFIMSVLVDHGIIGAVLYFLVIFRCIRVLAKLGKIETTSDKSRNLKTILTGISLSLVCLMVAGLGSNNKKLEIDIWLYALIPVTFAMLQKETQQEKVIVAKNSIKQG